jgi:hypothetical protein
MTFTIHRDNLAIVLPSNLRGEYKRLVEKAEAKNGGYLTLTVENVKRPRTTGERSQNRAINGYIQQICEDTGNDFDDVKMYCKRKAISHGYPMKMRENGEIVLSMEGDPIPESETKISVEEASILIETIMQLAGELGIILKNYVD